MALEALEADIDQVKVNKRSLALKVAKTAYLEILYFT